MYDKLVKRLRGHANLVREYNEDGKLFDEAADAIEELQQQVEHYHGCMNEWFEAAQEYKSAYIAEHDARIAEVKQLYDAFNEAIGKTIERMPLKIVLPEPPKEG